MEKENKMFIILLFGAIIVSASYSGSATDFGSVHCEYIDYMDWYECSDWNVWFASGGYAPEMHEYYEKTLGLNYNIPQTNPETWTVSNLSE